MQKPWAKESLFAAYVVRHVACVAAAQAGRQGISLIRARKSEIKWTV